MKHSLRASTLPSRVGIPPLGGRALLACSSARFVVSAARHAYPVLLKGETGSGKTHLARIIHEHGPRARAPFVAVNCASIPDSLFEREIFGHVRGAFTGASDSAPGFLEAAHRGTLFLDEIGELPPAIQPKLLTVLEGGTFRRIGSTEERRVDLKVIVATHRDLDVMIAAGSFRLDLFFRLSVFQHRIPALRERRSELPGIIRALLEAETGPQPPRITHDALAALVRHAWPGNLRELQNALRYGVVLARGEAIGFAHLPEHLGGGGDADQLATATEDSLGPSRYRAPENTEEEVRRIHAALMLEAGNRTRAARRLGMSRSSLWVKLRVFAAALDELRQAARAARVPAGTEERRK